MTLHRVQIKEQEEKRKSQITVYLAPLYSVGWLAVTGWVGFVWSREKLLINDVDSSDRLDSLLFFGRDY